MDLNSLYFQHQVSLHFADHSPCAEERLVHRELSEEYADQIASAKRVQSSMHGQ